MGQEEQDRLVGQAVRERAEVQKQLALIDAEVSKVLDGLKELMADLNNRQSQYMRGRSPQLSIPPAARKYMDSTELLKLLDQQVDLVLKRDRLAETITRTGA